MRIPVVVLIFLAATTATAQWQLQESHSKASFRGVHSLGGGVAWVSGTEGTVLRTEDGGVTWQHCTVPPGAEKLDFRGVQGFDAKTAFVMSSGTGDLSRLYKTTDGCQTWTLVFTNPDADGFFDALTIPRFADAAYQKELMLLGDPVNGHMAVWTVKKDAKPGEVPKRVGKTPKPLPDEGSFAASNSALFDFSRGDFWIFGTGGPGGARVIVAQYGQTSGAGDYVFTYGGIGSKEVPVGNRSKSSGVFSVAVKLSPDWHEHSSHPSNRAAGHHRPSAAEEHLMKMGYNTVVVGGDYMKPDDTTANAAYFDRTDRKPGWKAAMTQPHGFRSAVAYSAEGDAWIAVGPNGTDVSSDDGKNWDALRPGPTDAPGADKNWNALSLPFVVGPHGRIGVLRKDALPAE
ncbi:MAG TPA: hypothetical protein VIJ79_01960 [Acidobacteriaceae bacterium]